MSSTLHGRLVSGRKPPNRYFRFKTGGIQRKKAVKELVCAKIPAHVFDSRPAQPSS